MADAKMKKDDKREKIKAAIEKVNKNHGKTLRKLGTGDNNKFMTAVNDFIERYRSALRRLAGK